MKSKRFPNTYVIVSALIVLCALATFVVPAGEYVHAPDGALSYSGVARSPQSWQIFSSLYEGFVKQAGIIVFILIVGGAFWVLNATGAVSYGIGRFISKVGRHDKIVLAGLAVLFSLGGAVFRMSEETIPFVGIVVPLVIAMGYDAIVGLLVVYVASNIGFSGAFLNPFTVGIAQEMSGLPLFSGMGYRIFCWVALTALCVGFILFYASKVKRPVPAVPEPVERDGGSACSPTDPAPDPTSSVPEPVERGVVRQAHQPTSQGRQKAILLVLLLTVIMLITGVTKFGWYMAEISALFLAMGIICGIIAGYGANRIADLFVAGAKDILSAALIVGLASGIIVILQNGHIIDSILHSMEAGLDGSGPTGALSLMYGVLTLVNLLIPSATAKAAVAIPIFAPFCDMIGLSRQAMVLAFQFGDGFTNMLSPTSGVLLASLGMAGVSYERWVKWIWKGVLALIIIGFVLLLPTVLFDIAGF